MRFSVWPRPSQSFEEVRALVRHAEEQGWDGVWFADHFMPNTDDADGDTLECFGVLAALAATTERLRLGSLVAGVTYRHPAVLANQAATIDVVSGGRMTLGIGAGWQENEHRKYGIELPPVRERVDRFAEAIAVVQRLLREDRASFRGQHYRLEDAPMQPKPVQRPMPVLVGAGGERRMLRIVAEHADAWNCWGTPQRMAHKSQVLDGHCDAIGRDPATIGRSAQALVFLRDDPSELAELRETFAGRDNVLVGTAGELSEALGAYADIGIDEFILPDFNLGTGEQRREAVDRFWEEVAAAHR